MFPPYPPGYIQQDDMLSVIISSIKHFYPVEYPSIRNLDLSFEKLLDYIRDVCITQGMAELLMEEILQVFFHNDPHPSTTMSTIRAVRMEERSPQSRPPKKRMWISSHSRHSQGTQLQNQTVGPSTLSML